MTEQQYQILLALYHEYNEAFNSLHEDIKGAFFSILYNRAAQS